MYPVNGNGIPRLYVIRADGEKLFAGIGSLSGDKLPLMMLASLRQAGRSFNESDAKSLSDAVSRAQTQLEGGNLLAAAVSLSVVTGFGSPDDLQSFAKPALEAGEAYEQLVAELEKRAKAAQSNLATQSGLGAADQLDPLDDLIALFETEEAYRLFPKLKSKAATWTRSIRQDSNVRDLADQAEALVKARVLAAAINPRQRNRAPTTYSSIIRRFPGTAIDEIARKELAVIDPDAKVLQMDAAAQTSKPEFRQWTSSDGKFTTTAKLLQQNREKVQLQTKDGRKIDVNISSLSDQDREYLKSNP